MFDLTGKTALVTGSSRGIGRAIALALAGRGAAVAVHYHTREDAARAVAGEISALGRGAFVCAADARSGEQLAVLWREAEAALGQVDILVNNAGVLKSSFLAMTSEAAWDEVLDVDLKAAFHLSKLAARAMSRRKSGRIINISSQAGQMGDIMRPHYAAAKAGLIGLTKATARELATQGVTCNAVSPGFIETDLTATDEARREAQRKLVPLNRFGRAEEVAALVVYLASDEAAYVTGQCYAIDGGLRM
ncbi:MAG TPA: 3-oxoacyl-ACP reductase family protein [Abditibacteriaceae bacterium]|nr:3-oxoacyl-ACP reductase family protein [Abditibacteriaceae bacterium]